MLVKYSQLDRIQRLHLTISCSDFDTKIEIICRNNLAYIPNLENIDLLKETITMIDELGQILPEETYMKRNWKFFDKNEKVNLALILKDVKEKNITLLRYEKN